MNLFCMYVCVCVCMCGWVCVCVYGCVCVHSHPLALLNPQVYFMWLSFCIDLFVCCHSVCVVFLIVLPQCYLGRAYHMMNSIESLSVCRLVCISVYHF